MTLNPAWSNPKPIAPVTETAQETELTEGQPGQVIGGQRQMGKSFQAAAVDPAAQMWSSLAGMAKDAGSITYNTAALVKGIPQAQGKAANEKRELLKGQNILAPIEAQLAKDQATVEGTKTLEYTDASGAIKPESFDMSDDKARAKYSRERFKRATEHIQLGSPRLQKRVSDISLNLYGVENQVVSKDVAILIAEKEIKWLEALEANGYSPRAANKYLSNDKDWEEITEAIASSINTLPEDERAGLVTQADKLQVGISRNIAEENRIDFTRSIQRMVKDEFGSLSKLVLFLGEPQNSSMTIEEKQNEVIKHLTDRGLMGENTKKLFDDPDYNIFDMNGRDRSKQLGIFMRNFALDNKPKGDAAVHSSVVDTTIENILLSGTVSSALEDQEIENLRRENITRQHDSLVEALADLNSAETPPEVADAIGSLPTSSGFTSDGPSFVSDSGSAVMVAGLAPTIQSRIPNASSLEKLVGDSTTHVATSFFKSRFTNDVDFSLSKEEFKKQNLVPDPAFGAMLKSRNPGFVHGGTLANPTMTLTEEGGAYVYSEHQRSVKELRDSDGFRDTLRQVFTAMVGSHLSGEQPSERDFRNERHIVDLVRALTGTTADGEYILAAVGAKGEFKIENLPKDLDGLTLDDVNSIRRTMLTSERDRKTQGKTPQTPTEIRRVYGLGTDTEKSIPDVKDLLIKRQGEKGDEVLLNGIDTIIPMINEELDRYGLWGPEEAGLRHPNEIINTFLGIPEKTAALKLAVEHGLDNVGDLRLELESLEGVAATYMNAFIADRQLNAQYGDMWSATLQEFFPRGTDLSTTTLRGADPLRDYVIMGEDGLVFDNETQMFMPEFVQSAAAAMMESSESINGDNRTRHGKPERSQRLRQTIESLFVIARDGFPADGEGAMNEKGFQATMALAFLGKMMHQLDTREDGGSIDKWNPDTKKWVGIPTFTTGHYVRPLLDSITVNTTGAPPLLFPALIRLGDHVVAPNYKPGLGTEREDGSTLTIQQQFNDMLMVPVNAFFATMSTALQESRIPQNDLIVEKVRPNFVFRSTEEGPRVSEANEMSIKASRKKNYSDALSWTNLMIGNSTVDATLNSGMPWDFEKQLTAILAYNPTAVIPSPLSGELVSITEAITEFRKIGRHMKQQEAEFDSLELEGGRPKFTLDTDNALYTGATPKEKERLREADGKDVHRAQMITGNHALVLDESRGDVITDWHMDFYFWDAGTDTTGFKFGDAGGDVERNTDGVMDITRYPTTMDAVRRLTVEMWDNIAQNYPNAIGSTNANGVRSMVGTIRNIRGDLSYEEIVHTAHQGSSLARNAMGNVGDQATRIYTDAGIRIARINSGYKTNPASSSQPYRKNGDDILTRSEHSAARFLLNTPTTEDRVRFVTEYANRATAGEDNPENAVKIQTLQEKVSTGSYNNIQLLSLMHETFPMGLEMNLDPFTNEEVTLSENMEQRRLSRKTAPKINYSVIDDHGNVSLEFKGAHVMFIPPYMFPNLENVDKVRRRIDALAHKKDFDENGWPMFNNRWISHTINGRQVRDSFSFKDNPGKYNEENENETLIVREPNPNDFTWTDLDRVQGAWQMERKGRYGSVGPEEEARNTQKRIDEKTAATAAATKIWEAENLKEGN